MNKANKSSQKKAKINICVTIPGNLIDDEFKTTALLVADEQNYNRHVSTEHASTLNITLTAKVRGSSTVLKRQRKRENGQGTRANLYLSSNKV